MKTYAVSIQQAQPLQAGARQHLIPAFSVSSRKILALLGAVTAATVLVLLFTWLAGMVTNDLIGVSTWGLGFIFLGLAVDCSKWRAISHLSMGAALLGQALLQLTVSSDFTIVSGALITTWVAVTVFRKLQ